MSWVNICMCGVKWNAKQQKNETNEKRKLKKMRGKFERVTDRDEHTHTNFIHALNMSTLHWTSHHVELHGINWEVSINLST